MASVPTSLAPEVRALLAWDEDLNRRLDGLLPDEQRRVVRAALDERARRTGAIVEDVAAVESFAVAGGAGVRVQVYTPFGRGPHPAFLHVHGGGFVSGSIDWIDNGAKCSHICVHARCVVVTVEYRLAPEFPYPAAPEDVYAALDWLVERAVALNLDPTRVAIGGESAGGNLAAAVALMARDRGGPPLALQLLEVPVTDMSDLSGQHSSLDLFGEGYGLDRSNIDAFTRAYLPRSADRATSYASPLRAGDLAGLPPAHVLTAEFDPLRDSGEAYAERLRQAGVRTTLRRFDGHTHGSSGLWQSWAPARRWMDEVVSALRAALHPPAAGE